MVVAIKKPILLILLLVTSLSNSAQVVATDSIVNTSQKTKLKRYDGNSSFDTISVNGKTYIISKKELRDNFGKYTKDAQGDIILNGDTLSARNAYQMVRKNNRDSIRAHKNIWGTVLGGPAYTPESSFGLGGAVLLTFKFNPSDTLVNRSVLPFNFLATINHTFSISGSSEFYFKQNKIQLNTEYGIKYEPDNYFGVGFETIDKNHKSDSTTQYTKLQIRIKPILSFSVAKNILIGPVIDYTYNKLKDPNPVMEKDPYYNSFKSKYLSAGIGFNFRYDSRDSNTMPYDGIRFNASSIIYGKWMGGTYAYTYTSLDYRQYKRLFNRRSVLAWTARVDITTGNVPLTDLPSFGSPHDLRGYAKGHYRDKTMGYAIAEYRHMFGSQEEYDSRRPLISRIGFVAWGGTGTIGQKIDKWNKFKWNYGFGFRYEVQPQNNFRLDIGKSPKGPWMVYMNMIEAF